MMYGLVCAIALMAASADDKVPLDGWYYWQEELADAWVMSGAARIRTREDGSASITFVEDSGRVWDYVGRRDGDAIWMAGHAELNKFKIAVTNGKAVLTRTHGKCTMEFLRPFRGPKPGG